LVRAVGRALLRGAPWLMKFLSVAGTAAMFLVGGGILTHGIPALHTWVEATLHASSAAVQTIAPVLIDAVVGIAAGLLVLAAVSIVKRLRGPKPAGGHA
jgi:predicted DNA repair protein MutK